MYFLLSGEGAADLVHLKDANKKDANKDIADVSKADDSADTSQGMDALHVYMGNRLCLGPMGVLLQKLVELFLDWDPFAPSCEACGLISKHDLSNHPFTEKVKSAKKPPLLPGKKRAKETGYFFQNARILGMIAKQKSEEINVPVIAVLFRDSDGTASSGRGLWEDKRKSMEDGFLEAGFNFGVPMIPKPKSEAWLICALQGYQNCAGLEKRSGNDDSPNSLKSELQTLLPDADQEALTRFVKEKVEPDQLQMSSFSAFRKRLEDVINLVQQLPVLGE